MQPTFLVPESEQRSDGESEAIPLGDSAGKHLSLTLGITRIIEQESLDVSILGSSDGKAWKATPIASFPQKFYCGTYTVLLDLSAHSDVTHLKVKWSMSRWGRGESTPLFDFYVFAEAAGNLAIGAGV